MVERLVRTVKKSIRSALASGTSWKHELPEFLLAYRNTPHASTGVSPAQLLLGRPLRDKLTVAGKDNLPPNSATKAALDRDAGRKSYNKSYADKTRHAKSRTVTEGDHVLVRRDKRPSSFAPRYDPQPYEVTTIKGTTVSAQRDGKTITRNISWFTPAPTDAASTTLSTQSDVDRPSTSGSQAAESTESDQREPVHTLNLPVRPPRERKMPKGLQDFVVKFK